MTPSREVKAACPTEYADIELQWPQDPQAVAQMREFLAELDDPTFVSDSFVGGLVEDPDGEDSGREDLGERARARLAVAGSDGNAVGRMFELLQWLVREVMTPAFPELDWPAMNEPSDGTKLMWMLAEPEAAAGDAWYELRKENKPDRRVWSIYQALSAMRSVGRELSSLRTRMSPKKFKPKLRSGDKPADICARVAGRAGEAALYSIELQPTLASALDRLADVRFTDAGVEVRGREALHQAGFTVFGPALEAFAADIVRAYDRASADASMTAAKAIAAAERVLPAEHHQAVVMLAESPVLADRPFPSDAGTYTDAAWEVLTRATAEIATRVHSLSA